MKKTLTAEQYKDVSDSWRQLYEQKKRECERLTAENEELRKSLNVAQSNIERLSALRTY